MKINERLNLVIPCDRADGATIYVHATPISQQTFEAAFLLLSKTFAAIHAEGLGAIAGPRVAALMLAEIGKNMAGNGHDPAAAMLAEIRRLANVITPGARGWETIPLDDAERAGAIDAEDVPEVLGGIVFFTVGFWNYPRRTRHVNLEAAASLWGALLSSLNSTEYAASLRTSMPAAATGATAQPAMQATIAEPGLPTRQFSVPS